MLLKITFGSVGAWRPNRMDAKDAPHMSMVLKNTRFAPGPNGN
jgi:hypothetical protein